MKNISVSQKIKVLASLLILTIFAVISITIYLNQKNIKDATIVNIAGKQRMLTQKITKNIFYLYQYKTDDFSELDNAISEFNHGLKTLKDGNKLLGISAAPTQDINSQISKVITLWDSFEKNTKNFKTSLLQNDINQLNSILKYIYKTNNQLLAEVDTIVTLYTRHIEEKTNFIKNFQYVSFSLLLIFTLYALIQLRQIETHAREFIEKSKKISTNNLDNIELIDMNGETEFVEMADTFNCFINKISTAMDYSQTALEQSKLASQKLENLTDEFSNIISELSNRPEIAKQLDKSEDIVIESTEDLMKSTKKLQNLKDELDKLLINCKSNV
ncbi:type IV pili methyl-accepting chemotaxis transducer N-terminal domain-containing protein [Poseidonibacter sp.]|uniref:type IV pili methyl-accepting chemotaxis transducer N-terminal domain-containing protein n=1 Tax=Poseidonibacter sp. TaxID=2321188 RepID=UPI003C71A2FB